MKDVFNLSDKDIEKFTPKRKKKSKKKASLDEIMDDVTDENSTDK